MAELTPPPSQRRVFAIALAFASLPCLAAAQPAATAQIEGTARVGAATRTIVLKFSCALDGRKIDNIAIDLDLPDAAKLQPAFDVGPFEGPDGIGGRHHLAARAGAATASIDSAASGSFTGDAGTTFTFSLAKTPDQRAPSRQLQALVAKLAGAPGQFTWRIDNPKRGGAALEAAAEIDHAASDRLRAAMHPCFER